MTLLAASPVTTPEADLDLDRFEAFNDDEPMGRAVSGKRGGHGGRTRFQRDFVHMANRLHKAGVAGAR